MNRRIISWISLAVLASLLTACSSSTMQPVAQVIAPTPAVTSAPATFPLTLTDDLGRKVTLPSMPERIVSLAPSNTEILFAVGAGDQVVGLTKYCNYPPDVSKDRAIIGGFAANSISLEKVVSLQPDLVLTAGSSHKTVIEALEKSDVTVYALDAQTLDGIYGNVLAVGQMTGHASEAQMLVDEMKQRMAAVSDKVKTIPANERVRVFYEVWDEPLTTAGASTFVHQVIETAGGVNIFADVKEQYPKVSAETVIERNPDVIVGPSSHGSALIAGKIAARPGWKPVKAVEKERIVIVDGDMISRAGPRIVDAIEVVAKNLYPERFK
jgi:iron complex transport system substrate-binding protein